MKRRAKSSRPRILRDAARKLGHYVYLYVHPKTGRPFYVGKGKGQRGLAHLSAKGKSRKAKYIRRLATCGLQPRIEVLAHALPDEERAFRIECAAIDLLGLKNLTNKVRGWKHRAAGRTRLQDLMDRYAAKPVTIVDPVLLIRVNRLYRQATSADDLYDATRSAWKLGQRREKARFAFAVFEGVVKAVYEIEEWHRAGSTPFASQLRTQRHRPGRWEFTGRSARPSVCKRYLGRSVSAYLRSGSQNPVSYVNCPK